MKHTLAVLLLTLSPLTFARSFDCQVKINHELAFVAGFDLAEKASKKFGVYEEYEFTLMDKGSLFELEVYNSLEPSRSYAVGDFRTSSDLGLIIWKHDGLLEVSCKKN